MANRKYRSLQDRLLFNSVVCPETGCWVWLGAVDGDGYGKLCLRVDGVPTGFRAHRVAYECFKETIIREDMTLEHRCYNRPCINPGHLLEMSRPDNTRLAWARRRAIAAGEVVRF